MILYANGCSHTAASEALNEFNAAWDDPQYYHLKRQAHPDNIKASYASIISNHLNVDLVLDAENGSSNTRIRRTTREFLRKNNYNKEIFVLIGWSSWERDEWSLDGEYYQINSSGPGCVPTKYADKYKEWVINLPNNIQQKQLTEHNKILELHRELSSNGIRHFFVNTCNPFYHFPKNLKVNWGGHYYDPYNQIGPNNLVDWAKVNGFPATKNGHFRADAQKKWAENILPELTKLL